MALAVFLAGASLLTGSTFADTDNPYAGIVDRNVFQLRPPVLVPPPTNMPPPAPTSKLTLTGITTIFGKPRAMFTAQGTGKPQDAGREEHYSLTVGQRAEGIEVLSIDPKKGVVRLKNNGVVETLDFINNGAKLIASAAPAGRGPAPAPNFAAARSGSNRQLPAYSQGGNSMPTSARGNPYSYPSAPASYAQQSGAYQQPAVVGGNFRTLQAQQNQHVQQIDPVMQTIIIEKQRQETMDAVLRGDMPPLPPTPITPEGSPDLAPPAMPPAL